MSEPPPGALSAEVVARLRRLARGQPAPAETPTVADATATTRCDLCGAAMSEDHRHLLDVGERQILCACEPCIAMRAGEGDLRPTGTRVLRLDDFVLSDEIYEHILYPRDGADIRPVR